MTERLSEDTKGVYIISATPFDDDGSIDFDSADRASSLNASRWTLKRTARVIKRP